MEKFYHRANCIWAGLGKQMFWAMVLPCERSQRICISLCRMRARAPFSTPSRNACCWVDITITQEHGSAGSGVNHGNLGEPMLYTTIGIDPQAQLAVTHKAPLAVVWKNRHARGDFYTPPPPGPFLVNEGCHQWWPRWWCIKVGGVGFG